MKKFLSFLLAALMMISVFSGCSEEKPEEVEPPKEVESEIVVSALQKTITAVVYDRGEDEPYDKKYWETLVKNFEAANEGVSVNLIFTKDAAYEVRDRILSGNSPDFVFLPANEESGVTEALIKDKAMLPIDDVAEGLGAIPFDNNICKPYEDGSVYLAPVFFEEKGLIYNKELLTESGFAVPATWDDFISIAEGCKNKNYSFFTYAGAQPDEFGDIFAAALVSAIGEEEMNKLLSYDEEAWNREEVKSFVDKIESITKLVVSGSSTKSKDDTMELLENEKALFVSGTSKDLEELNTEENKYDMCAYPALSGNQTKIVTFSEMYIPVEAKEPELAKDFIKFVYFDVFASSSYPSTMFAAEFASKNAANESLSDEFCDLVVDVFKGNATSENFAEKMLEYIKEY